MRPRNRSCCSPFSAEPLEIIGVVQNAMYDSLNQDFPPSAYFPLAQISAFNIPSLLVKSTFEIRTDGNPTSLHSTEANAASSTPDRSKGKLFYGRVPDPLRLLAMVPCFSFTVAELIFKTPFALISRHSSAIYAANRATFGTRRQP